MGKKSGLESSNGELANLVQAGGNYKSTFYGKACSVMEAKNHVPRFPLKLLWEIHSRCQLQCEHCWAATNTNVDKPSKETQIERAKEFAQKGGIEVSFSGGDPLLSPRLEDIIRVLTNRNVACQILTNGELIPQQFDWISDVMGKGDRIQISIDGPKQVHETQRPGSDFQRVERAIELLSETNIFVSVHFTATPLNIDSIDETMAWCADRDIDHLSIGPIYPTPYDSGANLWERFDELEYIDTVATCIDQYSLDTAVFLPVQLFEALPDSVLSDYPREDATFRLEAGTSHMQIQADGRVYPGSRFVYPEFSPGNIRDKTLEELWQTDNDLWKEIRNGRDLSGTKCSDCRWAGYCKGGSTRVAYRFFDSIHRPDPFCQHIPKTDEPSKENAENVQIANHADNTQVSEQ